MVRIGTPVTRTRKGVRATEITINDALGSTLLARRVKSGNVVLTANGPLVFSPGELADVTHALEALSTP